MTRKLKKNAMPRFHRPIKPASQVASEHAKKLTSAVTEIGRDNLAMTKEIARLNKRVAQLEGEKAAMIKALGGKSE